MSQEDQMVLGRQLGAFANVDKTDARDFIERLDEMHGLDVFRAYKKYTFDLLGLKPGARVADVGCGTGEDISLLADLVGPEGSAVGFDLSQSMIDEATKRHSADRKSTRLNSSHTDISRMPSSA